MLFLKSDTSIVYPENRIWSVEIKVHPPPPRLAPGSTRLADLAGGELVATIAPAGSTVSSSQGEAAILETDLLATDGIIYVIDAVI